LAKLEQRAAARVPPIPQAQTATAEDSAAEEERARARDALLCRIAAREGRHLDLEAVQKKRRAQEQVFNYLFRSKEERRKKLLPLLKNAAKHAKLPDREVLLADLKQLEAKDPVWTLVYFSRSFDRLTQLLHAAGLVPSELAAAVLASH
jgi:hypothetical protein